MKKIILGGIAIVAIAVMAAVNVNMNSQSENLLSDLALANVEALADGEGGTNGCKFSLLRICTTVHSDHYLYRNL
jgi:hypothetical protein